TIPTGTTSTAQRAAHGGRIPTSPLTHQNHHSSDGNARSCSDAGGISSRGPANSASKIATSATTNANAPDSDEVSGWKSSPSSSDSACSSYSSFCSCADSTGTTRSSGDIVPCKITRYMWYPANASNVIGTRITCNA